MENNIIVQLEKFFLRKNKFYLILNKDLILY